VSHFEDSLDESQVRRLVEVRFLSKLVSHGPHIALFCREGEVFFDKKFDSDEWNLARKRAKESQNYLEKELRQLERQLLTDFDPVEVGGVDITDAFRFTSNELYRMPPIELLCPARSVE
jgi:hypothetical protein